MRNSRSPPSAARLAALAAVTFVLGCGAGASAAPAPDDIDTVSTTVRIGDLDPTQERDAKILVQRVRFAARVVCRAGEIPIQHRASCAEASTERAIKSLGIPSVTAQAWPTPYTQPVQVAGQ